MSGSEMPIKASNRSNIESHSCGTAATMAAKPTYAGFAKMYDRVMGDDMWPIIRSAFERSRRRYRIRYQSVADVGCGTGTFIRHLARRNIPVIGVDRSPTMLAIAASKTAGLPVSLIQQDLRCLHLSRAVDLLTCNFDTLNYLSTVGDLARALRRFYANLKTGGHVLFDLITGGGFGGRREMYVQEIELPSIRSRWIVQMDGGRRTSVVDMRSHFKTPGQRPIFQREVHVQHWFPAALVVRLADQAGLCMRGIHEMETHEPATKNSFWVQFVARR